MKIIKLKFLVPNGFMAITFFGLVFTKRELTDIEKNHEAIHVKQGNELLWIFFYIFYVFEFLIRRFQYHKEGKIIAYRNISFEREAYVNQLNPEYTSSRSRFSFIKYLIN